MSDNTITNPLWNDNSIQFARLIEEAQGLGLFSSEVIAGLCESMDLESSDVFELLDRARVVWEDAKAALPSQEKPLPAVLLVDESEISASFDTFSIYVNGKHITDADRDSADALADDLAIALNTKVAEAKINDEQLARVIAANEGIALEDSESTAEDWVQGYTPHDVIEAVCEVYGYSL